MKKRSKTKNQKSKKPAAKKIARAKNYESHYLAIALVVFLLLEGYLFSSTQFVDWQQGMKVLDMSTATTQTVSDITAVMQPVVDAVESTNEFYQLSATAMTEILDMSENGPATEFNLVTNGVADFFYQASIHLSSLLDVSSNNSRQAQVAGISVSR